MKFRTSVLQKEGFDAIFRITFENGLVLSSENVIWLGKRKADEIKEQFDQVVKFIDTIESSEVKES